MMDNVFMEDKIWFSPLNVVYHYNKITNECGNSIDKTKHKKMIEAYRAAIMLVGIIAACKKEYWMQLVLDSRGSPDIRTGSYKNELEGNDFEQQDVEVVEWTEKAKHDSIFDFLSETKLSNKKAYDYLTTILCYVNRSTYINYKDLHNKLIKEFDKSNNPQVMILGRIDPKAENYKLVKVFPILDIYPKFDLLDELKNKKYRGVLTLKKSVPGKIVASTYNKDDKHLPFERLL